MKKNSKQSSNKKAYFQIDLILSFLTIVIILIIFFNYINYYNSYQTFKIEQENLKYLPSQICSLLVYSSGDPKNWERNLLNLNSIGFKQINNYSIDKNKLLKLQNPNNYYYFVKAVNNNLAENNLFININYLKNKTTFFTFGKKANTNKINYISSNSCYSIYQGEIVEIFVEVWK